MAFELECGSHRDGGDEGGRRDAESRLPQQRERLLRVLEPKRHAWGVGSGAAQRVGSGGWIGG